MYLLLPTLAAGVAADDGGIGDKLKAGACIVSPLGCVAVHAGKKVTDAYLDSAIGGLVSGLGDALATALTQIATLWVHVDTPDPSTGGPAGTGIHSPTQAATHGIDTVLSYMMWIGFAVCILSLMVAGAKIGTGFRTMTEDENPVRLGTPLLGTILISGAGGIAAALFGHGRLTSASNSVGFIQDRIWWYAVVLAMASIIYAGIKMAWEGRGDSGRDLVKSLLTMVVVTAVGLPVLGLLVKAGDGFSEWIIREALNNNIHFKDCLQHLAPGKDEGECRVTAFSQILGLLTASAADPTVGGALPKILILILLIVAVLTTLVQIAMMAARTGILVVLAGLMPLAYSATNTEMGQHWSKKANGWLVAWLLYKPVAAIIYAAAFRMQDDMARSWTELVMILATIMLIVVACFALPIVMDAVMPAMDGLGHEGRQLMQSAMVPAMGALAVARYGGPLLGKLRGKGGGGDDSTDGNDRPDGANNVATSGAGGNGLATAGQQGGGAAGGGGAVAGGGAAAAAGPAGLVVAGVQAGKETAEGIKNGAIRATAQSAGSEGAGGGAKPASGSGGGSGAGSEDPSYWFTKRGGQSGGGGSHPPSGGPDLPGGSG